MPSPDLLAEFCTRMAQQGKLFEAVIELTHSCNLRCVHCFINDAILPPQSSADQWKKAIDQLVDMGLCFITFTGGEPLLYGNILDLVSYAFLKGCQVRIFSNGNLVTSKEVVSEFRKAGLCYFETSIYGATAAIHDKVTGVPGSFERTMHTIEWAHDAGIAVTVKSSWLSDNWLEYHDIVTLVKKLDVYFRGSPNVMIRIGSGRENEQHRMSFDDMINFFYMDKPKEADNNRSLNEAVTTGKPVCGIAMNSLAIGPDGTVFPCNHLRVPLGNAFTYNLSDLWQHSPYLKKLRGTTKEDFRLCRGCDLEKYCFVCMGDGWAEWGDPLKPSSETCMIARARQAAEQRACGKC